MLSCGIAEHISRSSMYSLPLVSVDLLSQTSRHVFLDKNSYRNGCLHAYQSLKQVSKSYLGAPYVAELHRQKVHVAALCNSFSGTMPSEEDEPLVSQEEIKLDLNLPRRRLLAKFTCNACGIRTERLINPTAYKRGTVFVQCAGCEVYHKLVDNLGLIVEYDFRDESSAISED